MASGWIKLYRQILDCAIWDGDDSSKPEPYCDRAAWIWLLIKANHRDKEIIFDGEEFVIGRGQILTSVRKLAKEWQWSNDKTLRYLRKLEKYNMIVREPNTKRTLITIVNYEVYQGDDENSRTSTSTAASTRVSHKQEYKEDKNIFTNVNIENEVLKNKVLEWLQYKKERRESYKETGLRSLITQIKKKEQELGTEKVIEAIDISMASGWRGIIWDAVMKKNTPKKQTTFSAMDMKQNYNFDAMERMLLG